DATVQALLDAVRRAGMLPAGIAYGTSETAGLAERIGLPLIAKFRAAYEPAGAEGPRPAPSEPPAAKAPAPIAEPPELPAVPAAGESRLAMLHTGSVRSGQ